MSYNWVFTVSPSTIESVTVSNGTTTEVLDIENNSFTTSSFNENDEVTVSVRDFYIKAVIVGTSSVIMTEKPKKLYAYVYNENDILYTTTTSLYLNMPLHNNKGEEVDYTTNTISSNGFNVVADAGQIIDTVGTSTDIELVTDSTIDEINNAGTIA